MNKDIDEALKKILGEDAFSIGNMQVSQRVQKLAKSVNYLVTQLYIASNLVENEDNRKEVKSHIELVISATKEILS
jgi:hypothetical protein